MSVNGLPIVMVAVSGLVMAGGCLMAMVKVWVAVLVPLAPVMVTG